MSERPILFSAPMVRAILEGRKTQTRRVVKPQPHADTTAMRDIPDTPFWYGAIGTKNDFGEEFYPNPVHGDWKWKCPYGKPGDRLWVRETWASPESDVSKPGRIAYNADGRAGCVTDVGDGYALWGHGRVLQADGYSACFPEGGADTYGLDKYGGRWRPSIHMPRWASRILLEIADVRVQRLQEISEEDAVAEGAEFFDGRPTHHHGWRHDANLGVVWSTAALSFGDLWKSINGADSWDSNPWVWAITFRRVDAEAERAKEAIK